MTPLYPLLGLLLPRARHGYELKSIVDRELAPFWHIDYGQLYRSLARLTRERWVHARIIPSAAGPDRKVYALTRRGRRAFQAWLEEPARDRNEFLVKVYLANAAGLRLEQPIEAQRRALTREHNARASSVEAARGAGDASRLVLADAALRETQDGLAALDLLVAMRPRAGSLPSPPDQIAISGSDDPLLAELALAAHQSPRVVGSLPGLLALAQHEADIAGVHLLDTETGEYNVPFIRRLVPEDEIILVNLAVRETGLIVARDNPKNIRGVRDLGRRPIRFINRQRGTGTRLLIHSKLRAAHIEPHSVHDWDRVASTHDGIAAAVAAGAVDVGPGLRATASAWGLGFIPLCEERYDLAISRAAWESPRFRPILSALHSKEFQDRGSALAGYDLTRCGRVIAHIK